MNLLVKDKQFYKQIKTLAIPIILQGMVMAGVGIMDTFMVGKLGEVQLSAASLANQFIMIYIIMCFGLGFGATVLTAQYFGSGDIASLKSIVTIMLRIMLVMSILFMAVTYIWAESIMSIYTPEKAIIEKGVLYFRILIFSFIFMAITVAVTAVLRSVGEVRLPLTTSVITFFINVGFNYIFIFGKLGAPRMEIEGAALGTLIARIFEALIIGGFFIFKENRICYRIKDFFKSSREYIVLYISVCIPVLISDTLLALGNNELAFYEAVKNGDMDKVKKLMLPLTSTGLGHLSDNPSRNLKYHFIITTAFITRFCIEGGMDTELAYTISDLYIQRVDVCNSCEEIKNMHKEMVYDLTNRMHSLKYKNIYTKKVVICIDYINANLHTRFTTNDLAVIVKLNPNYLCTLFKKETGITLSRYIRLQRIKASMNLLKYSEYTCLDIANFLCFSSHSHFISIFKKEVGLTPLEYRNKNFRHNWSKK